MRVLRVEGAPASAENRAGYDPIKILGIYPEIIWFGDLLWFV